ncbi:sugar ABC transporter permease [Devosia sp. BSSL-BM10]|uniref:Sugar ABC transporter permease n=1 Tax=Devosia litorisediminis TaxID=2829817 RepID=A0A942IDP6_9HYPH|nr:sugar ABC transporter permease [Devosia litorisediminis]MBS3848500.1 sugar ABC transporter permease [Devosia litorisediminis]|tara:strand:+ start:5031 stop:5966 length:936 start_codon:yes stop_codon:yes gene_type:complete
MTEQLTSVPADQRPTQRLPRHRRSRKSKLTAWIFIAPAFLAYATFVLVPLAMSLYYSFLRWDGIGEARFYGLSNYITVLTDSDLLQIIGNAFQLVLYFTLIPVGLGLAIASAIRGQMAGTFGTVTRTIFFLPQVIPLVAAGIAWSWMFASMGVVNQGLKAIGLSDWTRGWLGDFVWALPAVGVIGAWVLLGLCIMLLVTGITKIDPSLYEAARLDGARPWHEFVYITLPGLRQEIGVCMTLTIIAALASFDIVYIATQGGPGITTTVPGLEIYRLAFAHRQVGLASALAIVLMVLVLISIGPVQWFTRDKK